MNRSRYLSGLACLAVLIAVVGFWVGSRSSMVQADEKDKPVRFGRYTVQETDGSNLLVTDHQTNTFYFYTIDPEGKVGDELKLRATLDLNDVGKPTMKPKGPGK